MRGYGFEAAGWGFLLAIALALEVVWVMSVTALFARTVFKGKHRLYSIGTSFLIFASMAAVGSLFTKAAFPSFILTIPAHLIVLSRFKRWRIGA